MVENNVTSATTLRRFGCSPLLFTDVETTHDLMSILPSNVAVLCDLAHLNVSSNVLGFKCSTVLDIISDRTYGIHLSQSDKYEDTNKSVIGQTWYKKYLSMLLNSEFLTLETYDYSKNAIMNQYELREFLVKNISIGEALERMERNGNGILFVVIRQVRFTAAFQMVIAAVI